MSRSKKSTQHNIPPEVNANRTVDLWALTTDGYIIAEDIACQTEYVSVQSCPNCGHTPLRMMAQINRAFQGLNELVTRCANCREIYVFIFDISNEVYQAWWAERMGTMYTRLYDGAPRQGDPNQRYFP